MALPRSTHTPEHRQQVAAILRDYPDARVEGLPIALRDLQRSLGVEDLCGRLGFVPDAFRLNHDECEIEIFEVQVTHHLSRKKLRDLGCWWAEWDAEGDHDWLPVLIQVDAVGNRTRRDLGIAYAELC